MGRRRRDTAARTWWLRAPAGRRLRYALGCALVLSLAGAALAQATNFQLVKRVGLYSGYTTHAGCPRGKPIDPINVVWSGNTSSTSPNNIANVFSNRIGWDNNDYDSPYGADYQYVIRYPGHYCQRDHQPLRQCDGSYHSSDGYVAFLHG